MEQHASHDVFISFSFTDQRTADTIVNHLTNRYGISCWICTEEIRAGENFRTDISRAIKTAKLVVLVQSKKSAASTEVSKEVLFALKKGKMVKPFVIEDSDLSDELELELSTTHYIDATRPELEDRIRELAKDICKTLGRPFEPKDPESVPGAPAGEVLLSTPSVIPKKVFCGRDRTLEEIHRHFQGGERVLFLYGIGGIGKTQIAKQYAKRFRDDYDTIIYAMYGGSLQQLILSDAPFTIEPEMIRLTRPDGSAETDEAFFLRKLAKIRKLSNERTLIILDNFDVEADPGLTALLEGRYHLLITTRCDYSRLFPTLPIHPIEDMEDLKKLYFQNYSGFDVEEDDPALAEMIELVNRHTYTVELLAQHMENSGQTAEEMVEALKRNGILSLSEQVLDTEMKTQLAYENLLKLFRIFSLNEDEQKILKYLSLMPPEGINVRQFRQWAQLDSNNLIKGLIRKSWIINSTEGIALHPIICEVVKHELPATWENCRSFLNLFTEAILESTLWHLPKTEKDRYASILRSLLPRFPELTEDSFLLYYRAEILFSFAVDPPYAAVLAEKLWLYMQKTRGEEDYATGQAAFRRGWLYTYNSHMEDAWNQACIWLTKAASILEKVPLEEQAEKAAYVQTLTNLAKLYCARFQQKKDPEDYRRAVDFAERSLAYAQESLVEGTPHYGKLAGARWQLADVLCEGEEYPQALQHIDLALELLRKLYTENDGDTVFAMYRKAFILFRLGEPVGALELVRKSAEGYVRFFGSVHPNVYAIHMLLGDCCVRLQESSEAAKAYTQALETAKAVFTQGAEQITQAEQKLRQLYA